VFLRLGYAKGFIHITVRRYHSLPPFATTTTTTTTATTAATTTTTTTTTTNGYVYVCMYVCIFRRRVKGGRDILLEVTQKERVCQYS